MNQYKELAIYGLNQMKGDNLARAEAAFRNCTPAEMQEQYGRSGRTRAEILQEYKDHEAEIFAAILWVESQPD